MIGSLIAKTLVRRAFKQLTNRDLDSFLGAWADDAVFVYPGTTRVSGTHQGKEAVRAWFEGMLKQFPRLQFHVQHVCVERLGDLWGTNFITAEWTIEGESINGTEFENTGVTIIQFRFGKAVKVKDYIFDLEVQKRAWA